MIMYQLYSHLLLIDPLIQKNDILRTPPEDFQRNGELGYFSSKSNPSVVNQTPQLTGKYFSFY